MSFLISYIIKFPHIMTTYYWKIPQWIMTSPALSIRKKAWSDFPTEEWHICYVDPLWHRKPRALQCIIVVILTLHTGARSFESKRTKNFILFFYYTLVYRDLWSTSRGGQWPAKVQRFHQTSSACHWWSSRWWPDQTAMVIAMVVESDSLTMVISSSSADANHLLQGLDVLLEGHCVFQHQFVLWIGISMFWYGLSFSGWCCAGSFVRPF